MYKRFFSMLVAVVALGAVVVPAQSAFAIWCIGDDGVPTEFDGDVCPSDIGGPDLGGDPSDGSGSTITAFGCLLNRINAALNTIVPFLVGIAVFIVIWGVFKYIASAAEEEKRAEARAFVVWGVVGIFAMVSVWGFVNILVNSFSLSKQAPSQRPTLPLIPGSE